MKKQKQRYKTIKYYKLLFLLLLIVDVFYVAMAFLVDSTFNKHKIVSIIISLLIFAWNIGYRLYFKKHKVTKESFIIVASSGYKIFDVSNKYVYRLNKYLNSKEYRVEKIIIGFDKHYETRNMFIRIFKISNYELNESEYNEQLHKLLLN